MKIFFPRRHLLDNIGRAFTKSRRDDPRIFLCSRYTIITIAPAMLPFFTLLLAPIYIFTRMPESFTRATFDDDRDGKRFRETRALSATSACVNIISIVRSGKGKARSFRW